jgi:hypothetical protein
MKAPIFTLYFPKIHFNIITSKPGALNSLSHIGFPSNIFYMFPISAKVAACTT